MSSRNDPNSPCSSISTIPYPRDPDFVDVGNLIQEIHTDCASPKSTAVLLGGIGVGKSSLVTEYTYRVRERFPETSVIWLQAGSAARFEESCSRIVDLLNITDGNIPVGNKFIQLCSWFQDAGRKWVLVLDGASDGQLFHYLGSLGPSPIMNHLRQCPNGSVIVTTSIKEVALSFAMRGDVIHVAHVQTNRSPLWEMLERKVNRKFDQREIVTTMNTLGFLPLSIAHAAAYLNYRGNAYTVERYIEESCNYNLNALELDTKNLDGNLTYPVSTFMPWQLSFDYMLQIRPSAADLLCLASFFDRQGIPEYILRSQPPIDEIEDPTETDVASDTSSFTIVDGFEDDLQILKDLSLIKTDTTGKTIEMHSLVQFATQQWLKKNMQFDSSQCLFIAKVAKEFPNPKPENWKKCELLFPHVQAALVRFPHEYTDTTWEEWLTLTQNATKFIHETGGFCAAQKIVQLAKDTQKATLHRRDLSIELLRTKDWMGELCASMDCWQEAELLSVEGLHQSEEDLGQEHPETLRRMASVIKLHTEQGRYQDAEMGYRELAMILERVHGPKHPETLEQLSNLSMTLAMQERWLEAETPLRRAVEGSIFVLGEGSTITLDRMKSLVRIYLAQGLSKRPQGEALQIRIVNISKAAFGAEHPDTVESMSRLIDMHLVESQWIEAQTLVLHVLETQKKMFGEDHPSTLASMENLVFLCLELEQLQDAAFLQQSIIHLMMDKLGVNHYLTQRARNKFGEIRKAIASSKPPDSWEDPERWI